MKKRLIEKIKFLTEISCFDHYKECDGYYGIEISYCVWDDTLTYYPFHHGYLLTLDGAETYKSYEEAERALEEFVDECIDKELTWHSKNLKNPVDDIYNNPVKTLDDFLNLKMRYGEIAGMQDLGEV